MLIGAVHGNPGPLAQLVGSPKNAQGAVQSSSQQEDLGGAPRSMRYGLAVNPTADTICPSYNPDRLRGVQVWCNQAGHAIEAAQYGEQILPV